MSKSVTKTRFLLSLYATPSDQNREVFYSVVRAGHLVAGSDHRIERDHYPGHELIFCLKGRGFVRIAGRTHSIVAGGLLWVNCHHPHAYWADLLEPWELYWLRMDGFQLDKICKILSVESQPVFNGINAALAEPIFRSIFERMRGRKPDDAAWIHSKVARFIALAFQARATPDSQREPEIPAVLRKPVEKMRLYFHLPLRVAELAALAQCSPSHFNRIFNATFGTSPIDWLRRERINQAKRRLIESEDSIKEIARQTGYSDQFFFSKDFKQVTSLTPTEFRRRELGSGPGRSVKTGTRSWR